MLFKRRIKLFIKYIVLFLLELYDMYYDSLWDEYMWLFYIRNVGIMLKV